jgi:hypothetical protein
MVAQGKKPCPFLFSVAKPKLDSQKPYSSYLHYVQRLAQVKYQVPSPLYSVAKQELDSQKPYPYYLHFWKLYLHSIQRLAQVKLTAPLSTHSPFIFLQTQSWTLKNHMHILAFHCQENKKEVWPKADLM